MYKLKYRHQARNHLARLPFKAKSEIVSKLHELARNADNPALDAKRLVGEIGFRLGVGVFRVICTRHEDDLIIEIVKVRPRGDVYKR
jgi:mRNA interferase RelE/StbE